MMIHKIHLTHFWGFTFHGFAFDSSDGSPLEDDVTPWAPIEDGELDEADFDGYTVMAGELLGAKRPAEDFEDRNMRDLEHCPIMQAYEAWWAEAKRLVEAAGIQFVHYGDDEEDQFVAVVIEESVTEAKEVAELKLGYFGSRTPGAWRRVLRDFCNKVGIAWQEPAWSTVVMAYA